MKQQLKSDKHSKFLREFYVYAYVDKKDNNITIPVVINDTKFPIGIVVYSTKQKAEKRIRFENALFDRIKLGFDRVPEIYLLDIDMEVDTYLKAALHMFQQGVNSVNLKGIAGIAEEEFSKCYVYIDPPVLVIDQQMHHNLMKRGYVKPLTFYKDANITEIIKWYQTLQST